MAASEFTRVVLLGKGELAIQVAKWFVRSPHYQLTWVVPVIPEPTWSASLSEWARNEGVPVVTSGRWQDLPAECSPGLAVSVFCHQIFPQRFIERCGRIINVHNSPLPRYRGMTPINWALKNGEREHGVTLHEVTAQIDAGPIIDQVRYPIDPSRDEVIDVYKRGLKHAWRLMERALPRLAELEATPQDEALATHYTRADLARLGERRWFTREESAPRSASTP